jgi:hypothetical protein
VTATDGAQQPGQPEQGPKLGDLMWDKKRQRTGVFMGEQLGRVYLRDPAGGAEWEVRPADVRPVTAREELSARLAVRNAATRWGVRAK